jgi:1-deoxy-D-xylulose-5-phosphate reductoisomerase
MSRLTDKIRVIILGSTGSIGTQALEIARQHPDKIEIVGLTAHSNWKLLRDQVYEFNPEFAVLTDDGVQSDFGSIASCIHTKFYYSTADLLSLIGQTQAEVVLNSMVGFSGFLPTVISLESGKRVALANKESLVVGGELLNEYLDPMSSKIFPVDSEHSAIYQSLVGEPINRIEKLIITASGGPFRTYTIQDLSGVTVESALRHPNWSMGAKITIDSASMMNKGLEVIEAKWLFGLTLDRIEAVIHPQSIIHSMVTFVDGSTKAQLGQPDMKVPIQYALSYPDRWVSDVPRVDWSMMHQWTFEPIDMEKFPCFGLALASVKMGGFAPVVLNAANEIAVARFLNKEIPYIAISRVVSECLNYVTERGNMSIEMIQDVDARTRDFARTLKV